MILGGRILDFTGYLSHIKSEVTNPVKLNLILCAGKFDFTGYINNLISEVTNTETYSILNGNVTI